MRADILTIIVIATFFLAYRTYSKFLAQKIFKLDDKSKTPAHKFEDGVDYVPSRKHILFGHHFASIAGAAPIVGPCIACYWGWVPALIWVVLGSIVMGAVHDMGTLALSVRHNAKSMGSISGKILGKNSKLLFLGVIFFLVWLVAAAFAVIIARLFVSYPATVIPINIAIIVALILGYLFYKKNVKPLVPSIIALVILYAFIPVGIQYPVDLTGFLGFSNSEALGFWIVFLLIYGFVASVLPVWVLLQPRDYINSHQLIVGLGVLILGIFVSQPVIVAPEFNLNATDAPDWFPFLFVTVACGAISGFHGLVSSGTTSKQVNKETDIRPIGYGSMLIEATLALLALIAASAGFNSTTGWVSHYHSWENASKHGLDAFVHGAANFLSNLGLPEEVGATFIAIVVISFAATSLDTAFRIQRFIIAEVGEVTKVKVLSNRYLASAIGVLTVALLIFSDNSNTGQGAFTLWPVFGTSNQLLAALSMLVLAVYLFKYHRRDNPKSKLHMVISIPAVFLILVTIYSSVVNMLSFYEDGNLLLAFVLFTMLVLEILLCLFGINSLRASNK